MSRRMCSSSTSILLIFILVTIIVDGTVTASEHQRLRRVTQDLSSHQQKLCHQPGRCGSCLAGCPNPPFTSLTQCTFFKTCSVATCQPNYQDCDGKFANGCETALLIDSRHCGRCGNSCSKGHQCQNGKCVPAPIPPTTPSTTPPSPIICPTIPGTSTCPPGHYYCIGINICNLIGRTCLNPEVGPNPTCPPYQGNKPVLMELEADHEMDTDADMGMEDDDDDDDDVPSSNRPVNSMPPVDLSEPSSDDQPELSKPPIIDIATRKTPKIPATINAMPPVDPNPSPPDDNDDDDDATEKMDEPKKMKPSKSKKNKNKQNKNNKNNKKKKSAPPSATRCNKKSLQHDIMNCGKCDFRCTDLDVVKKAPKGSKVICDRSECIVLDKKGIVSEVIKPPIETTFSRHRLDALLTSADPIPSTDDVNEPKKVIASKATTKTRQFKPKSKSQSHTQKQRIRGKQRKKTSKKINNKQNKKKITKAPKIVEKEDGDGDESETEEQQTPQEEEEEEAKEEKNPMTSTGPTTPKPGVAEVAKSCDDGWADCTGDGICETNLMTSYIHCGRCGHTCSNMKDGGKGKCVKGHCIQTRPPCESKSDCKADNAETQCTKLSRTCSITKCHKGFADCNLIATDGCETNLQTNAHHCSECGKKCDIPKLKFQKCHGGKCQMTECIAGHKDCDGKLENGCETNVMARHKEHCGGCGIKCSTHNALSTCDFGKCRLVMCHAGWGNCDNDISNGCESSLTTPQNCGECGLKCKYPHADGICTKDKLCKLGTCHRGWANCDHNDDNGCEQKLGKSGMCKVKNDENHEQDVDSSQPLSVKVDKVTKPPKVEEGDDSTSDDTSFLQLTSHHHTNSHHHTVDSHHHTSLHQLDHSHHNALKQSQEQDESITLSTSSKIPSESLTQCGSDIDFQRDAANCGTCGYICDSGSICRGGHCTIPAPKTAETISATASGECGAEWKDCNQSNDGICEVNVMTDPSNCGVCGYQCTKADGAGISVCIKGFCAVKPTDAPN